MTLFRTDLQTIPSYVPGKPGTDPSVIKLSSNEMPYPPLPSIQSVIANGIGALHGYPDMYAVALSERIAKFHGVSADMVAVSNGSVAMIEKILDAACEPGTDVVIPWRSFEAYPIAITVAGADTRRVPVRADGSHDLEAMANAVTDRTAAVMVCSPNNPTGNALTHTELHQFLSQVGTEVLVVLDEAYIDFVRMDDPVRSIELLEKFPNLVILRTFSKAYSLAGLRVGYALGHPSTITTLQAVATPFGVNTLSQHAAIAALDHYDEIVQRTDAVVAERDRVQGALADMGYDLPVSQANFVWFEMAETERFVEVCTRHKITVRAFPGDGVRVSLGSPEANDRVLAAARDYAATLKN